MLYFGNIRIHYRLGPFVTYVIHYTGEGNELRRKFFERAIFEPVLVAYRSGAALPCGFTFWGGRPPAHFGDLELTGTKIRLPLHLHYTLCPRRACNGVIQGSMLHSGGL